MQTTITFENSTSDTYYHLDDVTKLPPFIYKPQSSVSQSTTTTSPNSSESEQIVRLKSIIKKLQSELDIYKSSNSNSSSTCNHTYQTASPPVNKFGGELMDFTESASKRSLSSAGSDEEDGSSSKHNCAPSKKGRSDVERQESPKADHDSTPASVSDESNDASETMAGEVVQPASQEKTCSSSSGKYKASSARSKSRGRTANKSPARSRSRSPWDKIEKRKSYKPITFD